MCIVLCDTRWLHPGVYDISDVKTILTVSHYTRYKMWGYVARIEENLLDSLLECFNRN